VIRIVATVIVIPKPAVRRRFRRYSVGIGGESSNIAEAEIETCLIKIVATIPTIVHHSLVSRMKYK
jgi:hypothetical protein